jgi:hypothetical protein
MPAKGPCDHTEQNTVPRTKHRRSPGSEKTRGPPRRLHQLTMFRSERASLPACATSHRATARWPLAHATRRAVLPPYSQHHDHRKLQNSASNAAGHTVANRPWFAPTARRCRRPSRATAQDRGDRAHMPAEGLCCHPDHNTTPARNLTARHRNPETLPALATATADIVPLGSRVAAGVRHKPPRKIEVATLAGQQEG